MTCSMNSLYVQHLEIYTHRYHVEKSAIIPKICASFEGCVYYCRVG